MFSWFSEKGASRIARILVSQVVEVRAFGWFPEKGASGSDRILVTPVFEILKFCWFSEKGASLSAQVLVSQFVATQPFGWFPEKGASWGKWILVTLVVGDLRVWLVFWEASLPILWSTFESLNEAVNSQIEFSIITAFFQQMAFISPTSVLWVKLDIYQSKRRYDCQYVFFPTINVCVTPHIWTTIDFVLWQSSSWSEFRQWNVRSGSQLWMSPLEYDCQESNWILTNCQALGYNGPFPH